MKSYSTTFHQIKFHSMIFRKQRSVAVRSLSIIRMTNIIRTIIN